MAFTVSNKAHMIIFINYMHFTLCNQHLRTVAAFQIHVNTGRTINIANNKGALVTTQHLTADLATVTKKS